MSSTAGAAVSTRTIGKSVQIEQQIVAAVVISLFALSIALSLVLVWRRLSGAFVQPLGGWAIVALAVLGELLAAALRAAAVKQWLVSGRGSDADSQLRPSTKYSVLSTKYAALRISRLLHITAFFVSFFPGLAAILLLAALTLPGTPAWGIVVAWFLLIAGEAASWRILHRSGSFSLGRGRQQLLAGVLAPQEPSCAGERDPDIPAGLVQQLTRVRQEGRESIHALVQAEIPPGDRLAAVHIAFCPPLDGPPRLTAHAVDADDAEVRITQAETFGSRIEVRLPQTGSDARRVLIEVLGNVTACRSA